MKSAIYHGAQDITIIELAVPECGPKDVILRNLRAGVCGSDVAVYQHGPDSHQIRVGGEFGHEVVSEVAAVGAEVVGVQVGDRVYPYPLAVKGTPRRAGCIGGFSEYIHVADARVGEHIVKVPDAISTDVAGLIEPFTVGHRAVRQSRVRPGERAIVFGAGTIGMGAAAALRGFGVTDIVIVDVSAFRLEIARTLGFATFDGLSDGLKADAARHFGEVETLLGTFPDVDVFIEAAGADSLLPMIQSMAKPGSRIIPVAVHPQPVPINFLQLTYGQQELIGPGGYTMDDVTDVLANMVNSPVDLSAIVTHEYELDDIVAAIEKAGDAQSALHVAIRY